MAEFIFYPYNNNYFGVPYAEGSIYSSVQIGVLPSESILEATATISANFILPIKLAAYTAAKGTLTASFYMSNSMRNFVSWSRIGSSDMGIDLVNDAGSMPMTFKGSALVAYQLDSSAIVYGTNGVSELYPVSSPAPTFGLRHIYDVGILGKQAVTGTEKEHYFISTNFDLCLLTKRENVKVLGYKQVLNVLSSNTVLTYDTFRKRLYIRDSTHGFIYTKEGLGAGPVGISSIISNGNSVKFYTYQNNNLLNDFNLITNIIDFESRVRKTITKVMVNTSYTDSIYVSIATRSNANSSWVWSSPRLCNLNNTWQGNVTGVEFKIRIYSQSDIKTAAKIDSLYIKYQPTDNRYQGGKMASQYNLYNRKYIGD